MNSTKHLRFPIGHDVTLAELEHDPYPVFERLRTHEPISWLPALNMWYVTQYEDVRTALLDSARMTTASEHSTIFNTFGAHMLTTEGASHDRYRRAAQSPFAPAFIRAHTESAIAIIAGELVDGFAPARSAELRRSYASRLPILVILLICGLPATAERQMRRWYDRFEAALANFTRDPAVSAAARSSVVEFHALLDEAIAGGASAGEHTLVARLVNAPASERLTNDEIKRNLSIIFFGGISTVEALLLNALWALFEHPEVLEQVQQDLTLIPRVIEETMRWLSPVQSATRHVVDSFEWRGVEFAAHDTVNCMLGAANRDPAVFAEPDRFDIDRINIRRHLGFATGAHSCLGSNLAKAEARIALETLLRRLPSLKLARSQTERPTGYEFRQSRRLTVSWSA